MAQVSATLAISLLLSAAVACDTAGEHEGCADGTDPSACPRSTFKEQNVRAADVSGLLRRGEDGVAGAVVHVAPAQATATSSTFVADVSTDNAGFYRATGAVPYLYDLSFKMPGGRDGRTDVLVYRDVAYRYIEPQLDLPERALPRSWIGRVQVRLDAPLAEGHTLLFLAAGEGVYGVTGDLQKGLEVHTARYEQRATIRAVEYDPAKGLISATAYGRTDLISDAGTPKTISLHLDPITETRTPTFTVDLAPGFVPGPVDIRISSSRTSDALLVSIPWGQVVTIPVVPEQGYLYRLRATRADGAVADSGEINFDASKPTAIALPAPPDVIAPDDGATIGANDLLVADGRGVMEDVLEPEAPGAPTVRLTGRSSARPLPDLRALAVENGVGKYTWTVRRYPTYLTVENVFGPDARRYRPVATSAPRTLVLR